MNQVTVQINKGIAFADTVADVPTVVDAGLIPGGIVKVEHHSTSPISDPWVACLMSLGSDALSAGDTVAMEDYWALASAIIRTYPTEINSGESHTNFNRSVKG